MNEILRKAADIKVGDQLYDNRAHYWLDRWPVVKEIVPISAGRLSLITGQRMFVERAEDLVLSRR